jgi:hypothetical protein
MDREGAYNKMKLLSLFLKSKTSLVEQNEILYEGFNACVLEINRLKWELENQQPKHRRYLNREAKKLIKIFDNLDIA